MHKNTDKFTGKAHIYATTRPTYAKAFIHRLHQMIDFHPIVADIGSGTGIFSKELLKVGCTVYGVEPNEDMRLEAKKALDKYSNYIPVNATAENTTLPDQSVDIVTAAQAFHWFDKEKFKVECQRILRGNGKVLLVWNSRAVDRPLVQENEAIFRRYCKDFKGFSGGISFDYQGIENFFRHVEVRKYPNDLYVDKQTFIGRNLSASYSLKEGDRDYRRYINDLEKLFDQFEQGGILCMPNETIAYLGQV